MKNNELFICTCSSTEHIFILSMCDWNDEKHQSPNPADNVDCYINVHLNTYKGFFGRLWDATKYVFGYKCKYGHFDEVLLNEDSATKLIESLVTYKEKINQYRKPNQ